MLPDMMPIEVLAKSLGEAAASYTYQKKRLAEVQADFDLARKVFSEARARLDGRLGDMVAEVEQ